MQRHVNSQEQIILWGTPEFAVPIFDSLLVDGLLKAVVTQPDRAQGRSRSVKIASPIKQRAVAAGIPILQPNTLATNFETDLKQLMPGTFLVVAYGKIIPQNILDLSALPAINIHTSLLPDLRGPSPIQSAIARGYFQTGITLMQLDDKMDHGPILAQKKIAITRTDTAKALGEKLSYASAQFVKKYIPRYLAGQLEPMPQDHSRATYCELINSNAAQLDLSKSAEEISCLIRAYYPWPGAFVFWGDKRLKILTAKTSKLKVKRLFSRSPDKQLLIRCGMGSIEAQQVQLAGKKSSNATDFLNGHPEILSN